MSSSRRWGGWLLLVPLATLGCVENAIYQSRIPMDYDPLPAPQPAEPTAGAIWNGTTRGGTFLFFDAKARGIGDLVTVVIQEDLTAEGLAETDAIRETSNTTTLSSSLGFQDLVADGAEALLRLFGINADQNEPPAGTNVNVLTSENESEFEGEGSTRREGTFQGVMTCRVVNLLPNGVFHIRGRRQIIVNHEAQWITLEGLVRKEDIDVDNTVASTQLAEARLSFDGIGVLDDKQRPGPLARVLDWIYPF